ncbi:TraX family protein [Enterococcus crotali]|uniref:TraX family protein n=1 Tax=Enterococcus crotali TaxID=1453587 RepID=UPI00047055F3|nr:TraX family protein [Enterococcus crotali]
MNGNQLKLIMMGLMMLDHLTPLLPPQFDLPIHMLTRCVAVFFAFTAVEGFHYTRNRKNYLLRLYSWAAIMLIGNTLINTLMIKDPMYQIRNNIFLTLAIGVSILTLIDFAKQRKEGLSKTIATILAIVLTLAAFIGLIPTEGGPIVIPFMLLSYFFRDNAKKRDISYLLFAIPSLIIPVLGLPHYSFEIIKLQLEMNPEFLFITVIPFIHLYNGKKGSNQPIFKYLFYVFYPAHLWIITLVNFYLNHA